MDNPNQARDKIQEILNNEEYTAYYNDSRSIFEVWWEKVNQWLVELLIKLFPDIAVTSGTTGPILVIFIGIIVALLIILFLFFFIKRKRKIRSSQPIQSLNEMDWSYKRHMAEAEKQEANGEYTLSTRHMFLALLLYFHEKEWLKARIWKTNWDYYDELRKVDQQSADQFYNLALLFDEVTYGERTVNEAEYIKYRDEVLHFLAEANEVNRVQLES